MAITRVQYKGNDGANPIATFDSAPTEGNLLVAMTFSRSGTSGASLTISGTGWTKRIERDTLLGDSGYRRSISVWAKVAGASEPSSIQVSGDTVRLLIQEFYAGVGGATWTFLEKADNDNGATSDATSIATGTTPSVADATLLLIGIFGARKATTGTLWDPPTWTSEALGSSIISQTDTSTDRRIASAFLEQSTGGTKASTADISGSSGTENSGLSAGIMVFKMESGGANTREKRMSAVGILLPWMPPGIEPD